MEPTVSIILPVYNSEDYLRRCLDSIVGQEYTDFELIVIDDGSTDSSGTICDEYQAADSRVRVIHKENEGVSAARNQAIQEAKGSYLRFVDSDDWITPESTKLMVRMAQEKGIDMVIADFYRVVGDRLSRKGDIEEDGVMTREEFASYMMRNPADYYYGVLWNKLFRRDIIISHGLDMNPKISWCEDFMFNLEYIRYAETFGSLRVPVYYYMKRKGSLVTQGYNITKTIRTKLTVFEYYHDFYKNVLDDEEYEKKKLQVYMYLIDAAGDGLVGLPIMPGNKKLGNERTSVSGSALMGEGTLCELYRERKLLEHYLEVAAIKNDLEKNEAVVLMHAAQCGSVISRRELADFSGLPLRTVQVVLQRLVIKGLIKVEDLPAEKPVSEKPAAEKRQVEKSIEQTPVRKVRITLLPAADPILSDLANVVRDYDETRFAEFDEDELIEYTRLNEKIKLGMQKVLLR